MHDALAALVQGKPAAMLAAIHRVYGFGFEMAQFSEELLEIVRNATFLRIAPNTRDHLDLSDQEIDDLSALVADVDPEQLHRLFAALVDVHDQVSRSPRPRLVPEMATARLATPIPVTPVATLVERLEELERRGPSGPKARGTGAPPPRSR